MQPAQEQAQEFDEVGVHAAAQDRTRNDADSIPNQKVRPAIDPPPPASVSALRRRASVLPDAGLKDGVRTSARARQVSILRRQPLCYAVLIPASARQTPYDGRTG